MIEINKAVFYDINPIPMKYMMKKMGIMPENEHRLPLVAATEFRRALGPAAFASLLKAPIRERG